MTTPVPRPRAWTLILLSVSAIPPILQVVAGSSSAYGYFIDELYYLACARHLAWGYVDHPPLSIGLLAAFSAIAGTSKLAIRIPAIAAVLGAIAVTMTLTKRLGGGRFAQFLAALCVATSPIALILGSFYSMNAIDLLLWPLVVLVFVRIAQDGDPRWWLAAGAIFGFGLENKHTMVTLAIALAVGVVVTPMRAHVRSRWLWLGV